MFDPNSRYRDNEDRLYVRSDGEEVVYRSRRLLPRPADHQILQTLERASEERLDQLASRSIGSPTQFWQLCDANGVMNPKELTERPRNAVLVPAPLFKVSR